MIVTFTVPGSPALQGSKRHVGRGILAIALLHATLANVYGKKQR